MINFFSDVPEFEFERSDDLEPVIDRILKDYGLKAEGLNVIFLTDDELLEINKQFLGHDYYTDIITFNYSETPGVIDGELYISIDRVRENASQNDVGFENELSRVIVHGVLHLAGFEDAEKSERENMQLFENKYLSLLRFT